MIWVTPPITPVNQGGVISIGMQAMKTIELYIVISNFGAIYLFSLKRQPFSAIDIAIKFA